MSRRPRPHANRRPDPRTNRRALLAAIGAGAGGAVAGCLDGGVEAGAGSNDDGTDRNEDGSDDGSGTGDGSDDGNGNGEKRDGKGTSVPEPDGTCGSEADPLSDALLIEADQDPGTCVEDMMPSFVVANEREESVTAAVEIAADDRTVFEETYSLGSGERAVVRDVGAAADLESVTVSLEGGESFSGEWPELACYRHAAVLTDDGLESGYVEPLSGPGDTQHDCYAGDPVPILLYNDERERTATVTVVDHCRESVAEETVELEAGESERLADALTNGGRYDVVVEVADGGVAAEEFYDACWGLTASIDGGDPEIGPVGID